MALIEVRDYHYDPDRMDDYRRWAAEAGPWLRQRWNMSGSKLKPTFYLSVTWERKAWVIYVA